MTAPTADPAETKRAIRARIVELAGRRGVDGGNLTDDEPIPESGVLDSVGTLELIIWIETTFDVSIDQSDLTLENFGTVSAIAGYLQRV